MFRFFLSVAALLWLSRQEPIVGVCNLRCVPVHRLFGRPSFTWCPPVFCTLHPVRLLGLGAAKSYASRRKCSSGKERCTGSVHCGKEWVQFRWINHLKADEIGSSMSFYLTIRTCVLVYCILLCYWYVVIVSLFCFLNAYVVVCCIWWQSNGFIMCTIAKIKHQNLKFFLISSIKKVVKFKWWVDRTLNFELIF